MPTPAEGNSWREALRWWHVVTSCVLEIALPAGGGYWLDKKFDTLPLCLVIGFALGMFAGSYHFYVALASGKKQSPPKE